MFNNNQSDTVEALISWEQALYSDGGQLLLSRLGINGTYSFTGTFGESFEVRYSLDEGNSIFHEGIITNGIEWNDYIDNADVDQITSDLPDHQTAVIEAMNTWSQFANITFKQDDANPNLSYYRSIKALSYRRYAAS